MLWYVHVVKYNLSTTMVQIYAEKDITSVWLNILSRNCTLLYLMTKQFKITTFYYCRHTILHVLRKHATSLQNSQHLCIRRR